MDYFVLRNKFFFFLLYYWADFNRLQSTAEMQYSAFFVVFSGLPDRRLNAHRRLLFFGRSWRLGEFFGTHLLAVATATQLLAVSTPQSLIVFTPQSLAVCSQLLAIATQLLAVFTQSLTVADFKI